MIVPEEFQDESNKMTYCSASINADYLVEFADDYFYNFVGKLYGINYLELVHTDFVDEFKKGIEETAEGESIRFVIPLMAGDDKYHLTDIRVTKSYNEVTDKTVIDMEMGGLFSMETRYYENVNNIKKYKTFLSMYNDFLFDYDFESDTFTIFSYDSARPNILVKDSFENAKKRILAVIDDEDSKNRFATFMDKVGECNEGFNFDFLAPTFNDLNKTVNYHVSCHIMYKHNRSKLAVGVLRYDDYDADIAYYQRPESKDYFTGVYNKKACQLLVNDTITISSSKHYMIVMDVDNFKNVNDNYGHLVGDQVILKMAEIINKAVAGRGIVGRFGGDEFFIFTNAIDSEEALRSMLGFIKKMMVKEFSGEFGESGLTCSMGVSLFPDDGRNYTDLFNIADKCLYLAKEKGKNRFIIYDYKVHGPVNEEDTDSGKSEIIKSGQEMAENMSRLLLSIPREYQEIQKFIENATKILGVDAIRVYVGPDSFQSFVTAELADETELSTVIFGENMTKLYKDLSFAPVSVLTNIQSLAPDVYTACESANIGGFFSCRHDAKNSKNNVRVFFDNLGRKSNYTQTQRDFMIMFTGIVASLF